MHHVDLALHVVVYFLKGDRALLLRRRRALLARGLALIVSKAGSARMLVKHPLSVGLPQGRQDKVSVEVLFDLSDRTLLPHSLY